MEALRRVALAGGLLYMIVMSFAAVISEGRQGAQPPPTVNSPTQAIAPGKGAASTGAEALAPRDATNKDAPKLKPEGESAVLALRNQLLADKVQIDQIQQEAQRQINGYMQDMQKTSRQLTEAQDKAFADAGHR